ncbi:MAG: PHP domain-containing protein [Cyanobacteria bacterium J06641_5]
MTTSLTSPRILRDVFHEIQADSCPYRYNFHMHTICSDGQLHPHQLIEQAVQIGLLGLAITDHHSVKGYRQAKARLEQLRLQRPQARLPQLWAGVEITAKLVDTDVHILGYDFDPNDAGLEPYLQGKALPGVAAAEVITTLKGAGGITVLAHPARYHKPPSKVIPAAAAAGIDGIEAYYAYRSRDPWRPSMPQTKQVRELGDRFGLLNTCGTDTHGMNLLRRI